jgi:thioredoxin 1
MDKYLVGVSIIIISLLVVGVALSTLTGNKTTNDTTPTLQWGGDLNQTIQQAKSTNKSIFVDFYADWCAYCKEMDEVTYTDPQVKEKLTQNYVLLKVDVDENPELSSKYQAYGLPTMLILDSKGNEVKRISGFQSPEQLLTQI